MGTATPASAHGWAALWVVLGALMFGVPAAAQLEPMAVPRDADGFPIHVTLDDITPFELHAGPSSVAASQAQSLAALGAVAKPVVREMLSLWVTPLAADESVSDWQINYEVTSLEGEPGVFAHERDPSSRVKVVARAMPPREVESGGGRARFGTAGARLYLHFEDVRLAGRYEGTVIVKLDRP